MEFNLKFLVLFVLHVLLSTIHWSSAKSLRELSLHEFNNLSSSGPSGFMAVYFDNKASRTKYPILLKELRKSSDVLDAYGVQIARLNCDGISISACSEENIYTFRNGVFEDTLELEVMFNENAIVANLLQALLKSEIKFISTFEQGQRMIQEAKHEKKDVVFAYVEGLGNSDHAAFMKIGFVYAENMTFGLTTDVELAKKFDGLSTNKGSLAVYLCKDAPLDQNVPCKVKKARKMTIVHIARLLLMLRVPSFIYLSDSSTTVYDTLSLSVDKLYIFTNKIEEIDEDEVKALADEFAGTGGVVIVNVKKHKDKLADFGLSESDSFPTAAYIPASSKTSEPNVELFPEKTFVFSMNNVKFFLSKLLKSPKKEYRLLAETSSLITITYDQFSKISSPSKTFLFEKSHLLLAFCEKESSNQKCQDFAKHYRRLVRTFERIEDEDKEEQSPVYFVYVTLDDGQDVHIDRPRLPSVRLYTKKNSDDFVLFKGKPDYDGLLEFLKEKTSMPSVLRLPPSNVDAVPINPERKDIKDEDNEEAQEERHVEKEEMFESRPEETEDDEVAGAVWYTDLPHVPEDKVPSLTDKTFAPTHDQNDLLVVNFFQPWDPRSRALVGPYVQAALSLGEKDVGNFNVRLARVNCFDWTDVCHKNNIMTYPTIKFFRKGSDEILYQGTLDADNLVKAVLMLHSLSPIQLESKEKVESFVKGEYPLNAKEASETAVVGLFAGADSKELQAFSEAANVLRGSFILGYSTGELAKQASMIYGEKLPAVFLFKRNDTNIPRVVFEDDFSARSIVDFIRISTLRSFGELTPINLPLYFKFNRPLLIAFRATAAEDSTLSPILNELVKDPSTKPIMVVWMSLLANEITGIVLETYTGKNETPALVLLHHNRGVLYHYKDSFTLEGIDAWLKRCLSGTQSPTRFLKNGNWKPILDGYDYLAMLDEEEKRKKSRENEDEEREEEIGDEPAQKTDPRRQRKPVDFREEIKEHDEL